jgi:hypothetical protein
MNTFFLVSRFVPWAVVLDLGFLLLGMLRALGLLSWHLERLRMTAPSRLGRDGLKVGKQAPDFSLPSTAGHGKRALGPAARFSDLLATPFMSAVPAPGQAGPSWLLTSCTGNVLVRTMRERGVLQVKEPVAEIPAATLVWSSPARIRPTRFLNGDAFPAPVESYLPGEAGDGRPT